MQPETPKTPEQVRAEAAAEQANALTRLRRLRDNEDYHFLLGIYREMVEVEQEAALNESLPGKEHRRALARYRMALKMMNAVHEQVKTLEGLFKGRQSTRA